MEIKTIETFILTDEEAKAWDLVTDILDTIRCRSEEEEIANEAEEIFYALNDFWERYLEG